MSFCRWGSDSDLYIFYCGNDEDELEMICCCGCILNDRTIFKKTEEEMIEHVKEHIVAGHKVPDYLITELKEKNG